MTAMAATTGRLIAGAVLLLLVAAACSDTEDDLGAAPDVTAEAQSTTSATAAPPTSTSETTATTLSDREQAEAEISRVVIDWYQFPIDTSQGNDDQRLEPLTGLLRQRVAESDARFEEDGVIRRSRQPAPIEIVAITADVEDGTAEVEACTGSADEFLDAETLEVLGADDPEDTSTSTFHLRAVDGQWKISEWISSGVDGDPIECEIGT